MHLTIFDLCASHPVIKPKCLTGFHETGFCFYFIKCKETTAAKAKRFTKRAFRCKLRS